MQQIKQQTTYKTTMENQNRSALRRSGCVCGRGGGGGGGDPSRFVVDQPSPETTRWIKIPTKDILNELIHDGYF